MNREEVFERLTEIFRDVFDDETIELSEETSSEDIEGWDSLAHINLIGAVEQEFSVRIPMSRVVTMKNVGEMADTVLELAE